MATYSGFFPSFQQAASTDNCNMIQYFCIADISAPPETLTNPDFRVKRDIQSTLGTFTNLQLVPLFIRKKNLGNSLPSPHCFLFLLFDSWDTNHKMKFVTARKEQPGYTGSTRHWCLVTLNPANRPICSKRKSIEIDFYLEIVPVNRKHLEIQ